MAFSDVATSTLNLCNACATGAHPACAGEFSRGSGGKRVTVPCDCGLRDHVDGPVPPNGRPVPEVRVVESPGLVPVLAERACNHTGVASFLKHRPLDKRGFPVPYISEWSDESAEAMERRGDKGFRPTSFARIGQGMHIAIVTTGKPGVGTPRLATLNPNRQRECALERKCQVCGKRINHGEDVVLVGGQVVEGLASVAFREPPMHRRCAVYSLYACPGINQADVMVVETRRYEVAPLSKVLGGHVKDPTDLGTVYRWPKPGEGFVEYLLSVPPLDADVHINPKAWRMKWAHLLTN